MRWRLVDTRRVHVLDRGPYAPVPEPGDLHPGLWETPRTMPGVAFDLSAQAALLRALAPHVASFAPLPGFAEDNTFYGPLDSRVLWAMLAHLRPRRVVELGSGFSSLVIAGARPAEHRVFDPVPSPVVPFAEPVRAQDVPPEVFAALGPGDVLFVDTTHTVRTGGDVLHVVLDVLPRLASGVVVHFHDVLLPWEVSRLWIERGWYWNEQDVLQAFLCGNEGWEVLLGVHALARAEPALVAELVPEHRGEHLASAFWLRRR